MIRAYRFELLKLRRRSVAIAMAGVTILALFATVLTFSRASKNGRPNREGYASTITQLEGHQGLTAGFVDGMSLIGLLIFVVFLISTTTEFSGGTIRSVLVHQPRRLAWATGKLGALLTALVASITTAYAVAVVASLALAPTRDVSTSAWFTADGIGHAAGAWLTGVAGAGFYGVMGVALGLLVRSTVIALAVGVAWAGPLEHITQNAWSGATGVFPGLSFDAVARGGVPDASLTHAVMTALAYAAVAGSIALLGLVRRDVTS